MKKFILLSLLVTYTLTPLTKTIVVGQTIPPKPVKSTAPTKFEYAFNSFKHYNERMDSATVNLFIDVAKNFNLYADTTLFQTCVSQICTESGAKQYYDDSSLVVSSGNAIGFSQIVPTTGYLFLKNVVAKDDKILRTLGGDEYLDIIKHKRCNKKARKKVIKWLSSKKNNIILWGYIMKYCMKKGGNLDNSLLVYNQGEGFFRRFLKNKKKVKEFSYIKHIKRVREHLRGLFNS